MASTNLLSKLSRALGAYLVAGSQNALPVPQAQVFPMFSTKTRDYSNGPIVTPIVLRGEPEPRFSGTERFIVHLSIKGGAAHDPSVANTEQERVAFDAMVGQVRDAFMQTDDQQTLAATVRLINAAAYTLPLADPNPQVEAAKDDWRKAANNADMNDFTVLNLVDESYGPGKAEDCAWETIVVYDCSAAESKIVGYT